MIARRIDPRVYHIAKAVVDKFMSITFLEETNITQEIVDEANKELKRELIKREMPEDIITLILENPNGLYPPKINIKVNVNNSINKSNKQITFYDEIMK